MNYKDLKKGDVVFLKGDKETWSWVAEVKGIEGNNILVDDFIDLESNGKGTGGFFHGTSYSRLATQEEKEMLNYDKYRLTREDVERKVVSFAESVGWDFDEVLDFVMDTSGDGLQYREFILLKEVSRRGAVQEIFDKYAPKEESDNPTFTYGEKVQVKAFHDFDWEDAIFIADLSDKGCTGPHTILAEDANGLISYFVKVRKRKTVFTKADIAEKLGLDIDSFELERE